MIWGHCRVLGRGVFQRDFGSGSMYLFLGPRIYIRVLVVGGRLCGVCWGVYLAGDIEDERTGARRGLHGILVVCPDF